MELDQLKEMVSSVLNTVTEKGREYAEVAADKTRAAGRLAKLSLELAGEREALKKAYAEIGRAYYEGCRAQAQGLFVQLCEEVEAVSGRIAGMEAEIAELKAGFTAPPEPDVDVSFEEVVEADESFAAEQTEEPKAGEPQPEEPQPEEPKE